jgi:chromatin remodeling complex protein RSC6
LESNKNINVDKVLQTILSKIQSPVKMREVLPLDNYLHNHIYELISLIAPIPPKSTGEMLNEEQIRNIRKFFLENINVLNYDSNKDCLR